MSGVTKQHFVGFKEQMRMRPMEYLARQRVSAAISMLLATDKSIAQIGAEVGYENPTYFGMVFKKYEGITPTDCRKRHGTKLDVVEACRAKRWFALSSSDRKMLLCSVTSTRIALAILAEQNAGFALF